MDKRALKLENARLVARTAPAHHLLQKAMSKRDDELRRQSLLAMYSARPAEPDPCKLHPASKFPASTFKFVPARK